eukprot:4519355-Pleurochrysis_carterae.AAC.2
MAPELSPEAPSTSRPLYPLTTLPLELHFSEAFQAQPSLKCSVISRMQDSRLLGSQAEDWLQQRYLWRFQGSNAECAVVSGVVRSKGVVLVRMAKLVTRSEAAQAKSGWDDGSGSGSDGSVSGHNGSRERTWH